jgi:hypothetical protein
VVFSLDLDSQSLLTNVIKVDAGCYFPFNLFACNVLAATLYIYMLYYIERGFYKCCHTLTLVVAMLPCPAGLAPHTLYAHTPFHLTTSTHPLPLHSSTLPSRIGFKVQVTCSTGRSVERAPAS